MSNTPHIQVPSLQLGKSDIMLDVKLACERLMPNYWVDPYQQCAFSGSRSDLVNAYILNTNRGGRTTVVACLSCDSFTYHRTLAE
jgi:hypothetical protein